VLSVEKHRSGKENKMKKLQAEFKAKEQGIRNFVNAHQTFTIAELIENVGMDCCESTMKKWLIDNQLIKQKMNNSKKQKMLDSFGNEIVAYMNEQGHDVSMTGIHEHFGFKVSRATFVAWIRENIKVTYEFKERKICGFCDSELKDMISDWYCEKCGKTLINKK